jgi:hypothetical protein
VSIAQPVLRPMELQPVALPAYQGPLTPALLNHYARLAPTDTTPLYLVRQCAQSVLLEITPIPAQDSPPAPSANQAHSPLRRVHRSALLAAEWRPTRVWHRLQHARLAQPTRSRQTAIRGVCATQGTMGTAMSLAMLVPRVLTAVWWAQHPYLLALGARLATTRFLFQPQVRQHVSRALLVRRRRLHLRRAQIARVIRIPRPADRLLALVAVQMVLP